MRDFHHLSAFCLLTAFLIGAVGNCPLSLPSTMKGMEIYSWQKTDGTWNYSLVAGTNRQKTVAEVTTPAVTLTCACDLKKKLAELPAGEYVTWLATLPDDAGHVLSLPPQEVQDAIATFCREHQLNLQINP